MLKRSLRVIYIVMLLIFSAMAHSCPDYYLEIGEQGNCYPQYTVLNSNYLDPNNPDPAWYDCTGSHAMDQTIQTNTTFVDGAAIVQVKCCGISYVDPPIQTAYLTIGQQHTFSIENTGCGVGNDNSGDSNPRGITNFAFTDLVKKESYSNPTVTLFKTVSLQNEVNLACALNWNNSQGLSALQIACNNVSFLPDAEQSFFTHLCEDAGYSAAYQPNTIAPNANNNNQQVVCTDSSTDLICNLPITCTLFCADPNCWSPANCSPSSSNPSTIISAQCFFMGLGMSPPPFCCDAPLPMYQPTTFPLCPNGYVPTSECVPPSIGSHGNTAPIFSSYFTPAIRVAFDVMPNVFQPVSPWVINAYNGVNQMILANFQGSTNDLQNTIQVCNSTGQSTCVTMPTAGNVAPMTKNLEIIYNTGTSLKPQLTRSPALGSLYGVNLGQYCDLNYDLANNKSLPTSTCVIEDMNKNPQEFTAKLTSDKSQICVYDANSNQVANCAPVPAMPLPSVGFCPVKAPDTFCMQVDFSIPANTSSSPNISYSAQITGSVTATSVAFITSNLYDPSGKETSLSVSGFITDDYYNGTVAGASLKPDINGNFCFDKNGKTTTTCSETVNPGGLWYVQNSNGVLEYKGGGTQICYISPFATSTNQASLCVPIVEIDLPFISCDMIGVVESDGAVVGGADAACPGGANVVNSNECPASFQASDCASPTQSDDCFIKTQACATPTSETKACNAYQTSCKVAAAKSQCYSDFVECTETCAANYYYVFLNGFSAPGAIANALAQYRACTNDPNSYPPLQCKFYNNAACSQKSAQQIAYCGIIAYQCNDYKSYCSYGQTQCYMITGSCVVCGSDYQNTCIAGGVYSHLPISNNENDSNLPNCSVANLTNSSYPPC